MNVVGAGVILSVHVSVKRVLINSTFIKLTTRVRCVFAKGDYKSLEEVLNSNLI